MDKPTSWRHGIRLRRAWVFQSSKPSARFNEAGQPGKGKLERLSSSLAGPLGTEIRHVDTDSHRAAATQASASWLLSGVLRLGVPSRISHLQHGGPARTILR